MSGTDWRALADMAIAYRDSKAFQPTTWETAPIRLACIHSEIRELEDAIDDHGRCATFASNQSVRFELSDIVMYALTVLHDLGHTNWYFRTSFHGGARRYASASELTRPLRKQADEAFCAWRKGSKSDLLISLEILCVVVVDLAVRVLGFSDDMASHVRAKIEHAASRPARHGNKDARS